MISPLSGENSSAVRTAVLPAVEAAQMHPGTPSTVTAETARKTTAALDVVRAAPAPASWPDRPALQEVIQDIVDSGFVGVSLRVNDERGEWIGSAGKAELGGTEKPPANGHHRIGSNTKTFTAALVLRLVAEGRFGLDDPVAPYLPESTLDERITLRMLLQHTSGLFNFTGEVDEDGTFTPGVTMPYGPTGSDWLDNRFTVYRPQDLVDLALAEPARFEPGTSWSYSNTNYVLARLLIETVTGRPYAEEMHRLILGPLGLSGTVVPDASPELLEPHAHAYYRHGDTIVDVTRQNPSWLSTGGDMISTTQDLHRFISALLGGRLLPAPLLAEMCTPRPTGIPDMNYGLGVFVITTGGRGTVISHNGAAIGHAALMYSTPDGSKTLTAALNCVDDAGLSIGPAFRNAQHRLLDAVFDGGRTADR
ncbi:serine hydrolase domain-containing protein [Actinoplanes sp. NPDC020271]|uniref:serine hydrolase domain-containing protein n=1 Tax=Actinoplanes sp. NPDC020271 TaxID=3363896 RepID=UPI0037B1E29D